MKSGTTSVLLRMILASAIALAPATAAFAREGAQAQQQTRSASLSVPVSGTVGAEGDPNPATLNGTLSIQRFALAGDDIVAIGSLVATYTDPATSTVRTIVTRVAVPLARQPAASPIADALEAPDHGPAAAAEQQECDILHLVLGPLDLDLLGLQVHLDRVVLDITAVPGAGNLLGNLLCAITGLLDGTGQLAQLVALLNQLLDLLG
jgi:hypothetical protein